MKRLYVEQRAVTEYNSVEKEMESLTKYKVTKVVNSIDPRIGDSLYEAILNAYCEDVEWIVEIK